MSTCRAHHGSLHTCTGLPEKERRRESRQRNENDSQPKRQRPKSVQKCHSTNSNLFFLTSGGELHARAPHSSGCVCCVLTHAPVFLHTNQSGNTTTNALDGRKGKKRNLAMETKEDEHESQRERERGSQRDESKSEKRIISIFIVSI